VTVFIDVFAGCGGLSLGLMQSGWKGIFAIERDRNAFETLSHNLIEENARYRFNWPNWLPIEPLSVLDALHQYRSELENLAGTIDLF
jgi:DNA (cytosine-5)-methyltransferase 1